MNKEKPMPKGVTDKSNKGLYSINGHFTPDNEIKKKLALSGDLPKLETPQLKRLTFTDYWSPRFIKRQEEILEAREQVTNNVEITFPAEPICLNFIGDIHAGGESDYKRVAQEIETIVNTKNSYLMLYGDLIDGFFFNYAQMGQIEQTPEQIMYVKSMFKYLAENKKLLVGWGGDHDESFISKTGNSMYADFAEATGAYFMYGVGYVTLNIGEASYKLTGAHRFPGNSIYNNTHPQDRAMRFGGAWGSDIIVSGHNHKKGHSENAIVAFGGEAVKVHKIALGPYKCQDDYSKKNGWSKQVPEELYGSAVILSPDTKKIRYYDDILEANKELGNG